MVLEELEKEGQNIRKAYQRRLPSDTSKDYYFIHRDTGKTQPIIVEYGFLDSTGDDVNQLKNDYENYASAVVKAVLEYIGKVPVTGNTYIVKSGDSLWSISKKLGVTVDELKKANNLTSNLLSIGQVLKIPSTEIETSGEEIYTVKSGDSLYSIARQYGLTVDEIKRYNNLTSNLLSIGQVLKIPTTSTSLPSTEVIYTVKSGDNLYSIAKQYGLTADEIMKYNNLTSNLLSIGQQLKIPVSNTGITYVVKSGDNLYSIANKYNTTVDEIKKKNNLTSNLLQIGQILTI